MSDPQAAVKSAFRLLAVTVDEVGPANTPLFLAKLALLLAHRINDPDAFDSVVRSAKGHLKDGMTPPADEAPRLRIQ
jgi:hypothetical protein